MAALGLLVLAAAGVTALVGALANSGGDHALNRSFELFGYSVQGSSGRLFTYGVIVGAVGMLGLNLLLAGLGRGFRSRLSRRRELKETRGEAETLQEERDRLARELAEARATRAQEAGVDAHRAQAGPVGPADGSPDPAVVSPPTDRPRPDVVYPEEPRRGVATERAAGERLSLLDRLRQH